MHTSDTDKNDQEVLKLLRGYPAAEASTGFFDQALVRATHEGTRRQRNRWLMTGFGSAIAAGTLAFLIPVVIVAFLLRRHLLRGVTFGAIRQ